MASPFRTLRSGFFSRLLSLTLAVGLLWIAMQHARYLCHAGAEHQAAAATTTDSTTHQGGCHDAATPVNAPSDDHSSVPACCITGVLVAALPSGKSLAAAPSATVLRDLSPVISISILPPSVFAPAPFRSLARGKAGESPFPRLRSHLAHQILLI
jgi:hypothetical protein